MSLGFGRLDIISQSPSDNKKSVIQHHLTVVYATDLFFCLYCCYMPVCPNPPLPLSVSESSSAAVSTAFFISCCHHLSDAVFIMYHKSFAAPVYKRNFLLLRGNRCLSFYAIHKPYAVFYRKSAPCTYLHFTALWDFQKKSCRYERSFLRV